jgi:hypothetical protein
MSGIGIIGAPHETTFKTWIGWMRRGVAAVREFAPYAAIEILLPGGSLMALLLWFYRRHKRTKTRKAQRTTMSEGQRTTTRGDQRTTTRGGQIDHYASGLKDNDV